MTADKKLGEWVKGDHYAPDYDNKCFACGESPVVVVITRTGAHHVNLCGPCTWGEADMHDPERWNE